MLSCSCGDYDGDGWSYTVPNPEDFKKLETSKRKRCCSCKQLIDIGSECVKFQRTRGPITEIEMKIYGDDGEIDIADWFMCESCGEIFMSLDDLGFCIDIGGGDDGDMRELLKEYQREYAHPAWQTFKDKQSQFTNTELGIPWEPKTEK